MKRAGFVLWVVALVVVGAGAFLLGARRGRQPATQAALIARYHCPMHPSYVSDKPGDCPILNPRHSGAKAPGCPLPNQNLKRKGCVKDLHRSIYQEGEAMAVLSRPTRNEPETAFLIHSFLTGNRASVLAEGRAGERRV